MVIGASSLRRPGDTACGTNVVSAAAWTGHEGCCRDTATRANWRSRGKSPLDRVGWLHMPTPLLPEVVPEIDGETQTYARIIHSECTKTQILF